MSQSPDITTRMSQARAAAAEDPVRRSLIWPAPPYHEFDADHTQPGEECLVVFKDGTKVKGALLDFLPDETVLKFQQGDEGAALSIAFSEILAVHLLRPLTLHRQSLPMGELPEEDLFAASERQPFSIKLVNGKTFKGETMGPSTRAR
jgi:hypothetical protein